MKTCVTCHQVKPLDAFNVRRSAPDRRQPRCRDCCKAWYVENKAQHRANVQERNRRVRVEYRERVTQYLAEHPCVDCGETDVRVLEFDHRPGEQKRAAVAQLMTQLVSWKRLQAEMDKCDVRCANCHRIRTQERGNYWRHRWVLEHNLTFDAAARLRSLFPNTAPAAEA